MKVVSVNIGRVGQIVCEDRLIPSAIVKRPVSGPIFATNLGLTGDEQAEKKVHGGPDMAVYAYPEEHYAFWQTELGRNPFPMGQFGENLTIVGLLESDAQIGDTLRVGKATLQISQPRSPCYKLAAHMNEEDFVRTFSESGRTGFYLRVLEEGAISAGDLIEHIRNPHPSLSVLEVFRLQYAKEKDPNILRQATKIEALSSEWRQRFDRLLEAC